jgi:hypothetical protein
MRRTRAASTGQRSFATIAGMQTVGKLKGSPPSAWVPGLSAGPLTAFAQLLRDWGLPVLPPPQALSEKLGSWLDWRDAVALSQALHAAPERRDAEPVESPQSALDWAEAALQRLRAELRAGFASTALVGDLQAEGADAATFRLHQVQQQRAMAARIAGLRERLRVRVAESSVTLARLAALDAVFDQALGARERQLLAALPAQLPQLAERLQAQAPEDWAPRLWEQLQRALQLELELRLQPVLGLIAALQHQVDAQAPTVDLLP